MSRIAPLTTLPFSGVVPGVIDDHVRCNGGLSRARQTHLPCAHRPSREVRRSERLEFPARQASVASGPHPPPRRGHSLIDQRRGVLSARRGLTCSFDAVVEVQHGHAEKAHRMVAAEHVRVVDIDAKFFVQRAHTPHEQPVLSEVV